MPGTQKNNCGRTGELSVRSVRAGRLESAGGPTALASGNGAAQTGTTIAAAAHAVINALRDADIDAQAFFDRCDVEWPKGADPLSRMENSKISKLLDTAVDATGDPAFGLKVGEALRPGNLHALGYALLASSTLRDFCNRLKAYYHIVSQNASINTEEIDGRFVLVTENPSGDLSDPVHDAYCALILHLMRSVYGGDLSPLSVELMRATIPGHEARFEQHFSCPVRYGCTAVRLEFDTAVIDSPLQNSCVELAQMNDQTVARYLTALQRADIVNQVRCVIVADIASSTVTRQHVADRLFLCTHSLQAKLAARNTSFQQILDTTRKSLAMGYLESVGVTVTEVSYLLGFADVANFTRAFRRWTGMAPSDFRLLKTSSARAA